MQIKTEDNTYVFLQDKSGEVLNGIIAIYAKSGHGKGLTAESIVEEFHANKFLIIICADPKAENEYGYAMFEPIAKYHLDELRRIGKPPSKKPVKLYHPFTFTLPKTKLPDINFYSFSLKDLGREEWSIIAESSWDTDTIKLLLSTSRSLPKTEGLYGFMHHLQDHVKGKQEGKKFKPDPKNFYLSVGAGTAKSLQDIGNYLSPFKSDFFLGDDQSPLKLNWEEILADQEHYHVFFTKWIGDKKLQALCILTLLNQIMANKDYAKHPILIVIPEIGYLTPARPQGYELFLAQAIKENLITMRSKGRGMSAVIDAQVYNSVDEDVANAATITLFGEMGGPKDLEKISKALRYGKDIAMGLKKMENKKTYYITGEESLGTFTFFAPSHRHCEPSYNFLEHYEKEYPEKMKSYKELIEEMRKRYDTDEQRVKERVKRKEEAEEERLEAKQREKEERSGKTHKVEEKLEKAKQLEHRSKRELMKLCWQMKKDNPEISFRELERRLEIHRDTVKKYVNEYQKIVDEEKKKDAEKDYAVAAIEALAGDETGEEETGGTLHEQKI